MNLEDKDEAVLVNVVEIDYLAEDYDYSDRNVINFIFDLGDQKGLILGYDLQAGSGSGWDYGAYVTLYYDKEKVASASW